MDPKNRNRFIDWDFTFAQPLQKAATFPKLLENVPGGAPPDIPEDIAYLDLTTEKEYFLATFAAKEMRDFGSNTVTRLIASSSERNFFEASLHRAPVHKEFVKKYCSRNQQAIIAAKGELNSFLERNPLFASEDYQSTISEVYSMLEELNANNNF